MKTPRVKRANGTEHIVHGLTESDMRELERIAQRKKGGIKRTTRRKRRWKDCSAGEREA